MKTKHLPTEIRLHQRSRVLEVAFDDGARFHLPCEYLRVYSPSAEVRGHAPGSWKLAIDMWSSNGPAAVQGGES